MAVVITNSGWTCDGIPVRMGVLIGSPLGRWMTRRKHELSECLNCGRDVWILSGSDPQREKHACMECIESAFRPE